MGDARSLVAVFEAITQNLEQDRDDLNELDRDDNDTGDNMVGNFRLVTETLQKQIGQGDGNADVGAALGQAAQVLREGGRGATAPIYAQGLDEAASRLRGQSSFSLDDLLPLLEGLIGGAQQAGATQGQGGLIDVLLPAVLSYAQAKRGGQGELEAILGALLETRRGANSTSRTSAGHGRAAGRNTKGEIDPGAAAAASLLEGLFGALLKGGLQSSAKGSLDNRSETPTRTGGSAGGKYGGPSTLPAEDDPPARRQPKSSGNPILDILGGLFGR